MMCSREVEKKDVFFLFQLTKILAKQEFWSEYVKELSDWLDARKAALGL